MYDHWDQTKRYTEKSIYLNYKEAPQESAAQRKIITLSAKVSSTSSQ